MALHKKGYQEQLLLAWMNRWVLAAFCLAAVSGWRIYWKRKLQCTPAAVRSGVVVLALVICMALLAPIDITKLLLPLPCWALACTLYGNVRDDRPIGLEHVLWGTAVGLTVYVFSMLLTAAMLSWWYMAT
ncbi:MAG TPA: hypothetical protein VGP72_11245 [Planctomycetota bacterium]